MLCKMFRSCLVTPKRTLGTVKCKHSLFLALLQHYDGSRLKIKIINTKIYSSHSSNHFFHSAYMIFEISNLPAKN